jgi:hypothetical protein
MFKNRLNKLCVQSLSCLAFFLFQINLAVANISITDVTNTTPGTCIGSIEVEAEGTANKFTILVSDGGFVYKKINVNGTTLFDGLCAGTYTVTVINEYMCETILEAEVLECNEDGFDIGFTKLTDPSSCNMNDGDIWIKGGVSGGTSPYSYEWSNGGTGSSISNLSGGAYTVTITDAIGCTGEGTFELMDSQPFELFFTENLYSCEGLNNGIAEVFPYNYLNQPTFSYLWSNGATTALIENLPSGTYSVTVTNDVSGCTKSDYIIIESQVPAGDLIVNATITPTCSNKNKGSILLSVDGGNPPYTYEWDTSFPTNGEIIINKPQGTYCTTVTDHCGNSFSECYDIGGPPSMWLNNIYVEKSCPKNTQGSITLVMTGGLSPYNLTLEGNNAAGNFIATANSSAEYFLVIDQLPPGIYTITITDDCDQTMVVPDITVGAWPTDIVPNPNTCTYDEICIYTGQNLGVFSYAGYQYQSMNSGLYNCTFYKVCNIGSIANADIVGGNVVNGDVSYSGGLCVTQRTCESPDGSLSQPYFSLTSVPTQARVVISYTANNSPDKCEIQTSCGGQVVATSAPFSCNLAIIGDETGKESDGINETDNNLNRIDENNIFSQVKQGKNQDILLESNKDLLVNIFPNPFEANINITFHSQRNQDVSLRLYNVMGQNVWRSNKTLDRGKNHFPINTISDLPKGLYIFELITADGKKFTKSLIH